MECIFCRILSGEIPSDTVYQDDRVIAIRDINPQAPTHILLMPRSHIPSAAELKGRDFELVGLMVNIANESLGLILFTTYFYKNGDLRLILHREKGTLVSLLPILSLMLLPFLYIMTQEFVFSSELIIVGLLHLLLTLLFIPSLFNGLKRRMK